MEMKMETKAAKDLEPGDKILDADGKALTIREKSRGFAVIELDGKAKRGIMLEYKEIRDWSQVHPDEQVTLAP